jgi:iron complex transport system permease protein
MKTNRIKIIVLVTVALLIVALFVQLSKGAYHMSAKTILDNVFSRELLLETTYVQRKLLGDTICELIGVEKPNLTSISNEALIIWNIRIPRFLIGICVGINLALAGCIFQTITKNELSSAYTLGISQGSGLSMLLILVLFPQLYPYMPFLAIVGGVIAFLTIYMIAYKQGTSPVKLVLSGVIIGSISIAIQKALYYFIQDIGAFQDVLSWTTGSLIGLSWNHFRMVFPFTLASVAIVLTLYKPMNLILLGDNVASSLGLSVEKWRFLYAFIGIMMAASAVSVSGLIGFVGLIVPHISRTLVGYDHKRVFIACIFIGSCMLVVCDTISRIMLSSGQIPVGIILNTIGGIFFIALMRKSTL